MTQANLSTFDNYSNMSDFDAKTRTGSAVREKIAAFTDRASDARAMIDQKVYDAAEEARSGVLAAIQTATDKLQAYRRDNNDSDASYLSTLEQKLGGFADTLSSKDSAELARDAKATAVKYKIPLMVAGGLLAVLALRNTTRRA